MVTDHKALEFFSTQCRMSNRQTRWMEFLSRFDHEMIYVQGHLNKVADCLSRYFATDTPDETHPEHWYVNADARLDLEGEDLPSARIAELRAITTRSRQRQLERTKLAEVEESRVNKAAALVAKPVEEPKRLEMGEDPTWSESQQNGPLLEPVVEGVIDLRKEVRVGYSRHTMYAKIIAAPKEF